MTEPAPKETIFDRVRSLADQGVPVGVGTIVRGEPLGAKLLVLPDGREGTLGSDALDQQVEESVRELLEAERSETRTFETSGEPVDVFIDVYPPAPRLLIFGGVHVAQPLSRFAMALGFKVTVVDARRALATRERFPDVDKVLVAWPDDAYGQIEITPGTYIAILTHDPKFDEPALLGALKTEARYIGAVGSRKTNADRRERLKGNGVEEAQLARIRGPIGLDIGANTPEEMAISILGEIIAVRHGRSGGSLAATTGHIRGERI